MTPSDELAIVRRAYAKQVMAAARVVDSRVENAFAAVKREAFLGPGPWPILRLDVAGDYVDSPSADPVYLYTNDLVGISPERRINNGQPSLHAHVIASAAPREGDHVVHVGAGLGYYSAVLAEMVGASGRVTAIEFEPDLAARLAVNVADRPQVRVVEGDGATIAFDPADVIYVNAGATRPADAWLDRLKPGGRLALPLTTHDSFRSVGARGGAIFVITRDGEGYRARWVSGVAIYPCRGMRDDASERALSAAFASADPRRVTRLRRTDDVAADLCWLKAPGWALTWE